MAQDFASKVRALLATAESYQAEGNAAAAATYFAKAEQIMNDYRISQADALAVDPTSAVPIEAEFVLYQGYNGFQSDYMSAFRAVAVHADVRFITTSVQDGAGVKAIVIGFEGDVRYCEYLWTATLLQFVTQIDPVWDTSLTEAENVFRLRHAGIERKYIADRAWGALAGKSAANRSKVQRIYLRECERRNVTPAAAGLGFQTDTYREAYARGFVQTLRDRLSNARDAAGTHRGLPALHGRTEALNEAFYTRFPRTRPVTYTDEQLREMANAPAPAPCAKCETNPSGTCRAHPYKGWTKAMEERHARRYNSPSAYAGHDQGARAADAVDLVRGGVDRQAAAGANDRAQLTD